MALFTAVRKGRRDDVELGTGVWRRAHDRFQRGLDRYHQVLEGVQDDAVYNQLAALGNELAGLLPRVRGICVGAQARQPSTGLDIPGAFLKLHRALSQAGNALATTAEAAAMLRFGGGESPSQPGAAVRRRAQTVFDDIALAERLLDEQD